MQPDHFLKRWRTPRRCIALSSMLWGSTKTSATPQELPRTGPSPMQKASPMPTKQPEPVEEPLQAQKSASQTQWALIPGTTSTPAPMMLLHVVCATCAFGVQTMAHSHRNISPGKISEVAVCCHNTALCCRDNQMPGETPTTAARCHDLTQRQFQSSKLHATKHRKFM